MPKLLEEFQPTLRLTKIAVPSANLTASELGHQNPNTGDNQALSPTAVYGIAFPLVSINGIVLDGDEIFYLKLDCTGHLPTLSIKFFDSKGLFKGLSNPTPNNEVKLQIIPPFEGKYKKINLRFYIVRCKSYGGGQAPGTGGWTLTCQYKLPDLYTTRIRSFGKTTTKDLFKDISRSLQLGFSSNLPNDLPDNRYIYCANQSYLDLMSSAVNNSYARNKEAGTNHLLDFWIDFWNHICLVDIYERYESYDPVESMKLWTTTVGNDVSPLSRDSTNVGSIETDAVISNAPNRKGQELYINDFNIKMSSSHLSGGSSKTYSCCYPEKDAVRDRMLYDADQHQQLQTNSYAYMGECYNNDFNYLETPMMRGMMSQKINEKIVEVDLGGPCFGLFRGAKVNLVWFDIDEDLNKKKDQMGIDEQDIKTNIPLVKFERNKTLDKPLYKINKTISGQYYILNSTILYQEGHWHNKLQLVRPRSEQNNYIESLGNIEYFNDTVGLNYN